MNAKDVMVVLKLIQATIPSSRMDEATPDVWANVCATVDASVGLEAAKRMTFALSSNDRFPAPADFLEYVKLVKNERQPERRALPEPPIDREGVKRMIAETRRVLAEQRKTGGGLARGHWHGSGDDKCPVCSKMHEPVGEF